MSTESSSVPPKDLMTWWHKEHTRALDEKRSAKEFADIAPGDKIRVHLRVQEGKRDRLQVFEGVCVQIGGNGLGRRVVVRKISHDEGVERTFPLWSSLVKRVELVSRGRVRRARLYYLRNLRGKSARIPVKTTGWVKKYLQKNK